RRLPGSSSTCASAGTRASTMSRGAMICMSSRIGCLHSMNVKVGTAVQARTVQWKGWGGKFTAFLAEETRKAVLQVTRWMRQASHRPPHPGSAQDALSGTQAEAHESCSEEQQ